MKLFLKLCSVTLIAGAIPSLSAQNADPSKKVELPVADADPLQAAGAKVFAERKDTAVTLAITRKVKGKDRNFEISAVAFDGKGLLVASLYAIESGNDDEEESEEDGDDKGELTKVALIRADATESEGDLVLTDSSLGLAFIRLRTPGDLSPMPAAVPLATGAPALLEEMIAITHLSAEYQRCPSAFPLKIAGILKTPRLLYVSSDPIGFGTPIYNVRGELVGVLSAVQDGQFIVPAESIRKLAATIKEKAPN